MFNYMTTDFSTVELSEEQETEAEGIVPNNSAIDSAPSRLAESIGCGRVCKIFDRDYFAFLLRSGKSRKELEVKSDGHRVAPD